MSKRNKQNKIKVTCISKDTPFSNNSECKWNLILQLKDTDLLSGLQQNPTACSLQETNQ